ncbi:MAG: ribonuclease E/G, partial [Deltaproteobacteria bacterium CG17_big_fil_post_rev_8_21_14_2_50_63_7]
MMINGQRSEELRVAVVDGKILEEYEIEAAESGLKRGNIYRGVVVNLARSLNAAFVDFGAARDGFLSIGDVVHQAYHRKPRSGRPNIDEVLEKGKSILVQVTKDAQGQKGAQLTTNISIAGRYLVLRPVDAKSGVSRKVDDEARAALQEKAKSLTLPEGFGSIVRTNALDQTKTTINRDANALVRLWERVLDEHSKGRTPKLLYGDQDLIVHAMRDFFDATINEVLIDDRVCFEKALAYVRACMPRSVSKLKLYEDRVPLFSRFGLEAQIEQIYKRKVTLPSGGSIVIDPTEALTSIDVNSARSTKGGSQDETAHHTNMEAAFEVARQLRLRDLGGLTVVDFIDMRSSAHQRDVEKALRDGMKSDKARFKIGRISPNGLLEINRQRIKQSLQVRTHRACPTCHGSGHVPSIEMVGLSLLRRIEAKAA